MRLIDADAFISFLQSASKSQNYKSVKIGKFLTVEDVLEAVISELDGTSLDGYKNAPTIEPLQQWIPCSETIDIPEREVLCCDMYGNEIIGYLAYIDEQWLCESETEMMYDPVAWMEKPEPWKGGKE